MIVIRNKYTQKGWLVWFGDNCWRQASSQMVKVTLPAESNCFKQLYKILIDLLQYVYKDGSQPWLN